jgi:hypothetical protein
MDVAGLPRLYGRIRPWPTRPSRASAEAGPAADRAGRFIGWLVWHLARVQDDHVASSSTPSSCGAGRDRTLGLDPDPSNTGYGHSAQEVDTIRPAGPDVLLDYLAAVDERTRAMLRDLTADDLDRVVDRRWDPPVTLGVRLVSVADDCLQHAGQAAYLRGLLDG